MTMPFTTSKVVFHGNGQTTQFPFSFRVWEKTQLDVQLVDSKGVTRPAQGWSVELTPTGGVITYAPASGPLPPGWSLVALRNMPFVQSVDLISGTRFDPQVIEDALDKATAERQQLREAVERSVKVPPASENPPELLAEQIIEASETVISSASAAAQSATRAQQAADEAKSTATQAQEDIATSRADVLQAITQQEAKSVTAVITDGVRQVGRVNDTADTSLVKIMQERMRAEAGADAAWDAVKSIPGVVDGHMLLHLYRAEVRPDGVYLALYMPEDGEKVTVHAHDYDGVDVLPPGACWNVNADGYLALEIY